jgi:alpha/beta hydrolase family protein
MCRNSSPAHPSTGWDYTDGTLKAVKLTAGNFGGPGSFGPTALYEFTYIAQNPVVAGLGFAALRDLATFFRDAKHDDNGVAMLTTDTVGRDLDLDHTASARFYLLSSLPHGAGTAAGICAQPQNPLTPNVVLRALLVDLDAWVSKGQAPPANRVPRRNDGTLVPALPQSGEGFPNIPGVTYNGIHHTGDLWDFGPKFDDGILSVLPPISLGTPYPVFVPKTDVDGNDIAGVRLPDVSVPLATYTGWALRAQEPGDPVPIVDGCDASGQKLPFAATKSARTAAGDPRLSIQERYKDHATYVTLVTQAAQRLEHQGFLLDQDVQAQIATAQAASVP